METARSAGIVRLDPSFAARLCKFFDWIPHRESMSNLFGESNEFMRLSPWALTSEIRRMEDSYDRGKEIRAWMRQVVSNSDMSVVEWARLSGVHKSTIFKALRDDYEFVPSTRTISKLADAVQLKLDLGSKSLSTAASETAPSAEVTRLIAEHIWEASGTIKGVPQPRAPFRLSGFFFPEDTQWVGQVMDDLAEPEYAPYDLVHVLDLSVGFHYLQPGQHVILKTEHAGQNASSFYLRRVDAVTKTGIRIAPFPGRGGNDFLLKIGETQRQANGSSVSMEGIVVGSYKLRLPTTSAASNRGE